MLHDGASPYYLFSVCNSTLSSSSSGGPHVAAFWSSPSSDDAFICLGFLPRTQKVSSGSARVCVLLRVSTRPALLFRLVFCSCVFLCVSEREIRERRRRMALEAVVFPQELFRHSMVGGRPWFYGMAGVEEKAGMGGSTDRIGDVSFTSSGAEKSPEGGPGELDVLRGNWPGPSCSSLTHGSCFEEPRVVDVEYSSNAAADDGAGFPAEGGGRRKRQRARRSRNREEAENQRMTHIAVERNRRRQMNDYLAALRSLMPPSYAQRGDQASIVGGAINFVKELEQLLQSLEAQKRTRQLQQPLSGDALSSPFGGFFTFPQYSSSASTKSGAATTSTSSPPPHCRPAIVDGAGPATRNDASAAADVEVTMVESHASLKVLSRRRPRQLLGMVAGLQGLRLTTLHLNATAVGDLVLYSFSLKVEDDCQLSSVNEIATAVHQMLDSPSPAPLQPTQHPTISSSPPAMAAVQRRD